MNKTIISVIGPTAIGKTKLAIALAQHYKTEIISADSRQFYKEMSIGTAVPSKKELDDAPHHFIQHKSIFDSYSVGDFEKEALARLDSLFQKNDIVILVGGSGLYVKAVTEGLDYFPTIDPEIRVKLNNIFAKKNIAPLQEQLKKLDSITYSKIDLNNPHRLIRALEVCIGTEKPYSSFLNKNSKNRPFNTITLGIETERSIIYDRINQRVGLMVSEGLIEEAKQLEKHKSLNALQTVGYRELFTHFNGEWTLDYAIEEIKKNTRRFAKRQLTWFRKNEKTIWVDCKENFSSILEKLPKELK
ncbi:MAG: tRNA (adenosine(37)-N6)-dimethylallyltransferase MiaA [Cellulophaga sp.]